MVSAMGTLVMLIIILLGCVSAFYLTLATVSQIMSSMHDIEIIENEEDFIDMFKNGLRNSCWKEYQEREDKASL